MGKGHDAHDRANAGSDRRIDEIFRGNARVRIPERLERANKHALLIDHARHRGERYQGRHQEEQHRKHLGDLIDAPRIGTKAFGADVLGEVQNVHVGVHRRDIIDFGLGFGKLTLGVGESRFGFGAFGGKLVCAALPLLKPAVVFRLTAFKLGLAARQLGLAARQLFGCGIELRLALRKTLFCSSFLRSELACGSREPIGDAGSLGVDLREGRLQPRNTLFGRHRLSLQLALLLLQSSELPLRLIEFALQRLLLVLERSLRFLIALVGGV